jgi:hypothetical protein
MTGPRRSYLYTCPSCGQEITTNVAYHARQRGPCRPCIRIKTGWHAPDCTLHPNHQGRCHPTPTASQIVNYPED